MKTVLSACRPTIYKWKEIAVVMTIGKVIEDIIAVERITEPVSRHIVYMHDQNFCP